MRVAAEERRRHHGRRARPRRRRTSRRPAPGRADGRRLGGQLQRPRPGRDRRRRPRRSTPAGAVAKASSAPSGSWPLPVGGAFHTPFMAPAQDRLRKAIAAAALRATPTCPVVANVDAALHTHADEWPGLLSAPALQPRPLAPAAAHAGRRGRRPPSSSSARARVLTGMAKRTVDDAATAPVATPEELDKLVRRARHARAPATAPRHRGRAPVRHRAAGRQPGRRRVLPRRRPRATVPPIEAGDVLGPVGDHEVRSRSRG